MENKSNEGESVIYIKFHTIRFKNFMAVGNAWIEIQLDQHETTLIYGLNGSGKTTLLDALTFALFGKAFRNINKPLLVNSINDSDCSVELEFVIGQIPYKIIRGIKPNIFEIYENGKMKNQDAGIYDYQDYLEKNILKFNFKTFKQIMVLGNKSFIPFMQLVAADRRSVIEELLDIQIFSAMGKVNRNKIDHLRDLINDLDKNIAVTQEKIDLQKTNILNNTTKNQTKIEANLQAIKDGENMSQNYQTLIDGWETEIANLTVITDTNKDVQDQLKKLTRLQAQMHQNHNKTKQQLQFFEDNDICPTCNQPIGSDVKKHQQTYHIEKSKELDEGLQKIEMLLVTTNIKLIAINDALTKINSHQTNIKIHTQKIHQLQEWNQKLKDENQTLTDNTFDAEATDQQLQLFLKDLEHLQEQLNKWKTEKKYYDFAAVMLKDGGIKTSIVKQYLPIMNNYINKYLSYMDFFANFTLNENFEESILARHRDNFAYESFSDGQKLRIDLALLFAWRSVAKIKNSVDTNILIMDEIIDSSLDNQGIEDFFKLISAFKETNIFIISPKGDALVDKFDHTIKFELKQDFSEIIS